jgi:hypothetical protein
LEARWEIDRLTILCDQNEIDQEQNKRFNQGMTSVLDQIIFKLEKAERKILALQQ